MTMLINEFRRIRSSHGLLIFDETVRAQRKATSSANNIVSSLHSGNSQRNNCKEVSRHLAKKIKKLTTIHGVDRIFTRTTSNKERIMWLVAFLAALLMLIYVCSILAVRYNRRLFQTVVDTTKYPIYKIYFPEVTICNENRLNWARLAEAKKRFLIKLHQNEKYEQLFTKIISLYDTLIFGDFGKFADLSDKLLLNKLNYINFTMVAKFMAWRCHEILESCSWEDRQFDCCEIFFPRISQLGPCVAFNSIESPEGKLKQIHDGKFPWHTSKYGVNSGVSFKFSIREREHSPFSVVSKGLSFMITEPYVWYVAPFYVPLQTRTSVAINGVMTFYDEQTRSVSSSKRECLFEDERKSRNFKTLAGHKYMFENCQSECQQKYLVQYCNCTMDLFFPPGPYKPCKLVDLPCLAKHNNQLLYVEQDGEAEFLRSHIKGMECVCFLNCYSLSYITDVRSTVLRSDKRYTNSSIIEMKFFFQRDSILVYRTTLVYTWIDLMASFGGVIALLLGCSLISAVEIFYFLIVDMPTTFWREHKNWQKFQKRMQKLQHSVSNLMRHPTGRKHK